MVRTLRPLFLKNQQLEIFSVVQKVKIGKLPLSFFRPLPKGSFAFFIVWLFKTNVYVYTIIYFSLYILSIALYKRFKTLVYNSFVIANMIF